jgi:hypothetical protein
VALRSPLSAVCLLALLTAGSGCSTGYQLTDGAYGGGGPGGLGGSNNPNYDAGSDGGLFDAGTDDGGSILTDGGCDPVTSPTGCYSLGSPCYPGSAYFNSGCATSLTCYSYVNDAGATQATCCQLMTDGTYLCQ